MIKMALIKMKCLMIIRNMENFSISEVYNDRMEGNDQRDKDSLDCKLHKLLDKYKQVNYL